MKEPIESLNNLRINGGMVGGYDVYGANNNHILGDNYKKPFIGREVLERIVVCVNACAGISTKSLQNGIIKEMITACKAIEDNWEAGDLASAARLCSKTINKLNKNLK
jgi:hypothetical protein